MPAGSCRRPTARRSASATGRCLPEARDRHRAARGEALRLAPLARGGHCGRCRPGDARSRGRSRTGLRLARRSVHRLDPVEHGSRRGEHVAVDHGYQTRPTLTDTFGVYLASGWVIQAVKLTSPGGQLAGDLDPLRMTFSATDAGVPDPAQQARPGHADRDALRGLRAPARGRDTGQHVRVHDAALRRPRPGRHARAQAPRRGCGVPDGVHRGAHPRPITGDYTFRQAADDTSYQRVTYVDVDMSGVTVLVVLGLLVAAAIVGVVLLRRQQSGGPGGSPRAPGSAVDAAATVSR